MSTHGVHAGCIEDMWQVAIEIAAAPAATAAAWGCSARPRRPAREAGAADRAGDRGLGGARCRVASAAFESLLESLRRAGVTAAPACATIRWIESVGAPIANAAPICNAITGWENRWYQRNLVDQHPDGVSERAKAALAQGRGDDADDYRAALIDASAAQRCHAAVAPLADAVIMLSCPGPAPLWAGDLPGEPLSPRPTGDSCSISQLDAVRTRGHHAAHGGRRHAASASQVMGQPHEDAKITAMARWLVESLPPSVGA